MRFLNRFIAVILGFLFAVGCGSSSEVGLREEGSTEASSPPVQGSQLQRPGPEVFSLSSAAFQPRQSIPPRYTCDEKDVSPPLQWSKLPENAQTLALIMDDPDAPGGTWVHWVVFNLPADARSLEEGITQDHLPDDSLQGKNSWGRIGYGGPCPPGGTHRYIFKLYALDTSLDLEEGASKEEVLEAMEGHVLANAELVGLYKRQ